MTYDKAREFIHTHADQDDLDQSDIDAAFTAIFERDPDDDDREAGLWSLMVAACAEDASCDESAELHDSCMTRSEADERLRVWNSQKPQLFVLLMRDDGEWSETAYGEPCISSDEDDMQVVVNDLFKNCPDFRGAKFGYSDYPFESPYIIERLFDENDYSDE